MGNNSLKLAIRAKKKPANYKRHAKFQLICRVNDGGLLYVSDKLQPYLPPPIHEMVHVKVEAVQGFFNKLVSSNGVNGAGNLTATGNASTGGLFERIGGLHPVLSTVITHPATAKAISYLPELSKKNAIYFVLFLLCWEGSL
jgi:hypothetical protein